MPSIISKAWLARELGVSAQLLQFHFKKPDAPSLDDVEGWREFLARQSSNPKTDTATDDDSLRDRIARKRLEIMEEIRAEKVRVRKINAGKIMDATNVHRFMQALMFTFYGELDRLAQEFPTSLKGKNEIEINEEVLRQIEAIKKNLTDKMAKQI